MLKKTIKKVLRQKIESWANSVKDSLVKEAILNNTIVTGGAIVSLVNNEDVNDYDIYFTNFESLKLVVEYYVKEFNKDRTSVKAQVKILEYDSLVCHAYSYRGDFVGNNKNSSTYCDDCKLYNFTCTAKKRINAFVKSSGQAYNPRAEKNENKYIPKYITSNAITLSDDIQIVLRFYGSAEEIHENYDFVHCTGVYDSKTNNISIPSAVYDYIVNKVLHYQGSKYPLCSVIRLRKFIKRGYTINAGQILKMCYQISKLDLNDMRILEDQLTGVDSYYFSQVIDALQDEKLNNPNWQIDELYLCKLIDKIFE